MKRQHGFSLGLAAIFLGVAALAASMTGWRWWGLRNDLGAAERASERSRDQATRSILGGFSLPANRPLRICNQAGAELKIPALAVTYWGRDGRLTQFNSAERAWHAWTLSRGEDKTIQFDGPDPWDGSAIFYAIEVERADGGRSLIAGTSDDLKANACIGIARD